MSNRISNIVCCLDGLYHVATGDVDCNAPISVMPPFLGYRGDLTNLVSMPRVLGQGILSNPHYVPTH